jgi:hypothetical protein
MLISGSVRELRAIIDRAWAMDAAALHFIFPNHVIALPRSGEYSYFRTTLFFSHSALLPKQEMLNIRRFLKRGFHSHLQDPHSLFFRVIFESIAISDEWIEFDRSPDFRFEIKTKFEIIDQASELLEKIEAIGNTSIDTRRPYLKLSPDLIEQWYKHLSSRSTYRVYGTNNNWNINKISFEQNALILERSHMRQAETFVRTDIPLRTIYTSGFTVMQDHADMTFCLYDLDIITFRRLNRELDLESIIIIPFDKFYLIEGHKNHLIYKCYLRLRSENASSD